MYTRNLLGTSIIVTNGQSFKDIGMELRDPVDTVKEAFEDMIEKGHLKAPSSDREL